MKKIFSISLILAGALAFTACVHEEGDIFDQSAAERLNEASDLYSARLGASVNGWAMQYYPTYENEYPYGSGYLILMDFNADGSVTVAMNNQFTNNRYLTDTSLWEVITDDGPVLSFNSYNKCMHAFSDPEDIPWTGDSDAANDEQGEGAGGDYEFIVVDAPEDGSYLMLKGKKRGTYNLLTPVEEGVEYESYLNDVNDFQNLYFAANSPTFDVFHLGDILYKIEGANDGLPNIYPYDGDPIADESFNPFLITKRGDDYYLRFRDKKEVSLNSEEKVQDFRYDPEKDVFESVDYPENFIEGDNPARYFNSTLEETTNRWSVQFTGSDEATAIYNQLVADFKSVSYTLENVTFGNDGSNIVLRMTCSYYERQGNRQVKKTTNYNFKYASTRNDDVETFAYQGCDDASQRVYDTFASVKTFVDSLSAAYNVEATKTRFNLNYITLAAVDNTAQKYLLAK